MRRRFTKPISILLSTAILSEIFYPACVFALTGGPSQPEVQSFEPAETKDLVDPFSGDFQYNIPLLNIDGYPINISYHSGITMDQEASWVGLGWNINPGVINRSMRGLPDDFKGDVVTKKLSQKPNITIGAMAGFEPELAGFPLGDLGVSYSLGLRYNNYTGTDIEKSVNVSFSASKGSSLPLTGSLGLSSSKENGLTIQPSISLSKQLQGKEKQTTDLNLKVGTAFNTRAGLKSLTIASNTIERISNRLISGVTWNFGMPTYTPQVMMPMENFSLTGSFKTGGEFFFLFPNFNASGYYSSQKLSSNEISNPAYGYIYTDRGSKENNTLLDFNREKDGSFTESTPALPLTNFTYDLYSVSGQGTSGSFRPFRSDMGYVFDPEMRSTSKGGSVGVEVGVGSISHWGVDLTVNSVNTYSGRWKDDNQAAANLDFTGAGSTDLYEPFYFKEANEKSVDADSVFFRTYGSFEAYRVNLDKPAKFKTKASSNIISDNGNIKSIDTDNFRHSRERRNEAITMVQKSDLDALGLETNAQLYAAPPHHIAEITSLGVDGRRYVYGIAAYNKTQEEITFATGATTDRGNDANDDDCNTGLVEYSSTDNSQDNKKGIDRYYSNTILPAYAHSYLLTAVLSTDYVDNDDTRGPSDGDLGTYTKFNYSKIANYKWRTPIQRDSASHTEGLKSIYSDDKGNIIYGEKELWYLESIVSKNYIAVFHTSNREDALSVDGVNGGITANNPAMQKLDSISLYTKSEYLENPSTAVPLQRVHFEYDYSLCKNIPNQKTAGQGKLTLEKIFFTYQNSNKARHSPFNFEYNSLNPNYNLKAYDRWGNYKPQPLNSCTDSSSNISNAEFPYVIQDKTLADQYSSAWTLTDITTPEGGKIKVHYESDDYGYVQNKRAMQMFKIVNINNASDAGVDDRAFSAGTSGDKLYFKLSADITDINKYLKGIDTLYFRFLMEMDAGKYEFISGYAMVKDYGVENNLGWVRLKQVKLKDNASQSKYNPIVKAAIQFGRTYMSKQMYEQSALNDTSSLTLSTLTDLLTFGAASNLSELINGPNQLIYDKVFCRSAIMNKSWIRLNEPTGHKLGGGCRVKKIETFDEWSTMTNSQESSFSYGEEYTYLNKDGTSSGVASYEPQLGGDENPLRLPVFFDNEKLLAPDETHYMEAPFGESFFPSPSVGYGQVTVKNLQYANVKRHATGSVVHEFYTARDFPVITSRTDVDPKREKDSPYGIRSLLNIEVRDYMTASQGYSIELNDMHGKPKSQKVYQEDLSTPISSVEYRYNSSPYLNSSHRLDNTAAVINPDGTYENKQTGVFFDGVFDAREQKTSSISPGININVEATFPFIVLPSLFPAFSSEKTRFRSMVFTKVMQRFGLLEETIAYDLGSKVSVKNLAYDSQTGDVLLTQTTTNFNDSVYTFTYPAHWYYDGMSQAYKNIGYARASVYFDGSGLANIANAPLYFAEGDELGLYNGTNVKKAWVTDVKPNSITVVYKDGNYVFGTHTIKVIRSGRKNMAATPIQSLLTKQNPLSSLSGNIYEKVLQANSTEFSDQWRTNCECFLDSAPSFSSNPYVLGTRGNWRPRKAYLHLTARDQSDYNNNTNIREDGSFASFSPFYKLNSGKWNIDEKDWTFATEVTEFNSYSNDVESKDALGRYSAKQFSFNQTFMALEASNAKYKEVGFDSFEDYDFSNCADEHFKFPQEDITIDSTDAHSGRNSIVVSNSSPANLTRTIAPCPTQVCNLAMSWDQRLVTASGGSTPYSFEWEFLQGSATVKMYSDNQLIILPEYYVDGKIIFTVTLTDSEGCKLTMQFERIGT